MRNLTVFLAFCLLLTVRPTAADEKPADEKPSRPRSVAEIADAVIAAVEAKDDDALARLAAKDDPDPWLVAEALDAQDRNPEAVAFARAAPRADVRALPAYVAVARSADESAAQRALLARALKALEGDDTAAAIKMLRKGLTEAPTIAMVRLHHTRGRALYGRARFKEAALAFDTAATIAEKIGWLTQAAESLYQTALSYEGLQQFSAALVPNRRRLAIEQRLQSTMGRGRVHYGLYVAHVSLGAAAEAREHLEQARALATESGDREYLAKIIASDGVDAAQAGDAEAALQHLERAIAEIEKLDALALPARFVPVRARIIHSTLAMRLSAASTALGMEAREASVQHARAARDLGASLGNDRVTNFVRAFLAVVRGANHEMSGESYEALREYERARDMYRDGRYHTEWADCIRRMGRLLDVLGDHDGALKLHGQAIELLTRLKARRLLWSAHCAAAGSCMYLGRAQDVRGHVQAALELARRLKAPDLKSKTLVVLARLEFRQAQYAQALALLQRAFDLQRQTSNSPSLGRLRHLEASIYMSINDDEQALRLVEQAIVELERMHQWPEVRSARELRARLLSKLGRHGDAVEEVQAMLQRAMERASPFGVALARARLADIYFRKGDYARAAAVRSKVVGMFVSMGNEKRALEARIQGARETFWSGERDLGIEELEHAEKLAGESGSPWLLVWAAVGLAEANLARGEYAQAVQRARNGVQQLNRYAMGLADGESALAREGFASLYEIGLEAAWRLKDGEQIYEFIERGRASELLAALGGRGAVLEASVSPALRAAEERARSAVALVTERHNAVRRRGAPTLAVLRGHRKELEAARERLRDAVSGIRRSARLQADLAYQGSAAVADVQSKLALDEALVLFAPVTDNDLAAVVVTKKRAVATLLKGRPEIRKAVADLVEGPDVAVDAARVATVRKLLIEPLRLGAEVKRLLISPSPELAYVPFALIDPGRDIVSVPSATVYGVLRSVEREPGSKVLALGDPDYGAVHGRAPGGGPRTRGARGVLARLPATRAEVEAIGDVLLVGKNATETKFRKIVSTQTHWRAVHFACHGLVDPKQPALCSLELTADEANDGSLWALEIFRTQVPADLVVLSGCETGKGRVVRGEGIIGLVRAFMQAGAPRVIASLWKVDDEATRVLMVKFYELWNPRAQPGDAARAKGPKPLGAAAALRKAQAYVRSHDKWKHPYYWAAWVLWGLPD